MSHELDTRRRWFEEYISRIEQGVIRPAEPDVGYTCPCCGFPTLEERGGYNICYLCNWEDDGQDDPHADEVWGGPNGSYSLSEARTNFARYLIMYDPGKPATCIGGNGNAELERQAKSAIIEAFETMVSVADTSAMDALRRRIRENKQILDRELRRKVQEHEQKNLK